LGQRSLSVLREERETGGTAKRYSRIQADHMIAQGRQMLYAAKHSQTQVDIANTAKHRQKKMSEQGGRRTPLAASARAS